MIPTAEQISEMQQAEAGAMTAACAWAGVGEGLAMTLRSVCGDFTQTREFGTFPREAFWTAITQPITTAGPMDDTGQATQTTRTLNLLELAQVGALRRACRALIGAPAEPEWGQPSERQPSEARSTRRRRRRRSPTSSSSSRPRPRRREARREVQEERGREKASIGGLQSPRSQDTGRSGEVQGLPGAGSNTEGNVASEEQAQSAGQAQDTKGGQRVAEQRQTAEPGGDLTPQDAEEELDTQGADAAAIANLLAEVVAAAPAPGST